MAGFLVQLVVLLSLLIMLLPACGGMTSVPKSNPDITPLHSIQGAAETSPFAGQNVIVSGVVTGDFQDGDADKQSDLGGFFIQEKNPDGDTSTSEGLFVFDRNSNTRDVRPGDEVKVVGVIEERFGETQITASSVDVTGRGGVDATELGLPLTQTTLNSSGQLIANLEAYEGMLVTLPQVMTVSDLYGLERFGEILLSQGGRLLQFTNIHAPDVAANATHVADNALRSIILDDGSAQQNVSPVRYINAESAKTSNSSLRVGDTTSNLRGVIRYGRGSGGSGTESFRLLPVLAPQFESGNARSAPPAVGGDLKVMSFNALNFFTTTDNGQNICGPNSDSGCRGADSVEEFVRQRKKIVNAILATGTDIVGLMEIENNPRASLQSIVDGLNAGISSATWSYIDTGIIGTDAIRVGLIYNSSTVSPVGQHALLDSSVDRRFMDTKNRPTLAQTFSANANRGRITVAVNHLKSKGSDCNSIEDPDLGDGQGNCNLTRVNAAAALADWLAKDPTDSDDLDILIIGDLNAYLREDPVQLLVDAGYENILDSFAGGDAYSFVFRGQSGALDHAFASPSLAAQVAGVGEWHINADEPPLLDYNLDFGRDETLFDPASPFRASDHDPVVIGLSLTPD